MVENTALFTFNMNFRGVKDLMEANIKCSFMECFYVHIFKCLFRSIFEIYNVMLYFVEKTPGYCERPLGMESGQIRDNQLSCKSFFWQSHHRHAGPTQARFKTLATSSVFDAWIPYDKMAGGEWLMVCI